MPTGNWNLDERVGLDGARRDKRGDSYDRETSACHDGLRTDPIRWHCERRSLQQTTGTGDGQQAVNSAAQADQRHEHAQPSVAQQPQSTGKAEQPNATEQSAVPSAKMTDQDQSLATPSQASETSTKMADQGC